MTKIIFKCGWKHPTKYQYLMEGYFTFFMHIDRTHSIVFPFNHLIPRCGLGCNFQYSRSSFLNLFNLLGVGWGKNEKVSNKNIQIYIFPTTYHWESFNHDLKLGTYSQDSLHFYLHILMWFFFNGPFLWPTQQNFISVYKSGLMVEFLSKHIIWPVVFTGDRGSE